jgi:TonB family protein
MIPRLLLLAILLLPVLPAQNAPAPKPIDRNGFFEAVRLGGLKPEELIAILNEFGVDFRLRPEDQQVLEKLGAGQRLIEAVRKNYRGGEPQPPAQPPVELPGGPPLTRAQVVLALQAGVDPAVVVDLLRLRGAAFLAGRDAAAEILAAGGNAQVVGAAVVNMRESAPNPPPAMKPRGGLAPAPPAQPLRVPGPQQARKLIRRTQPDYPVVAARMKLQGKVLLEVLIGAGGDVRDVKVLSGHAMLSTAAVAAVRNWAYEPTLVNGVPAEVLTEVELTFSLNE